MKALIKKILLLFFFCSFMYNGWSAEVLYDSSAVTVRKPSAEKQQELFSDSDFLYDKKGKPPSTFWDRVMEWFNDFIRELLSSRGGEIFTEVFKYLLIAASLVFIVILLLKNDVRMLFYKKGREVKMEYDEWTEDINKIDFDKLIDEAIAAKNFRRAVRLYFLKTLKLLSDKNLIEWKPEKTNYDFYMELKEDRFKNDFRNVSILYDYVWYGDFNIGRQEFDAASEQFKRFNRYIAP